MDCTKIMEMLKEVINMQNVSIEKIPDIDLYIDQVTTFIESNLKDYKRDDKDKIITKTMVNNYTKDKIITNPVKKKYNRKQVIMLILIYHLKNILSINDISKLISNFESDVEQVYSELSNYKAISDEYFCKDVENLLANFKNDDDINLIILVINLINEANNRKRLAEKIIDTYF